MIGQQAVLQVEQDAAPAFAALGDPRRLSIIHNLCESGPLPTIKLKANRSGVSRQAITKHLRVLERAGLINSFRIGRDRHWQVRVEQLTALREYLDAVAEEWDARIERLKLLVVDRHRSPNQ